MLKKQAKAWIENIVETIGGQRIAPMWDTRRGFLKQFFTQEYEGRDIDISLIPWKNHRSLFSAMLHCIYNPSEEEFYEWGEAAERETWRYIPKIKTHVAVEMTLDRCVQRLRTRLLAESREAKSTLSDKERMSSRVPSFFTSASLVNMSGLGITDRYHIDEFEQPSSTNMHTSGRTCDVSNGEDIPRGWNGMGLRGNFSSGSLNRSTSGGSGLFLMDGEPDHELGNQMPPVRMHIQDAGEAPMSIDRRDSGTHIMNGDTGYTKTTSMAQFYYRKSNNSIAGATDGSDVPTPGDGAFSNPNST